MPKWAKCLDCGGEVLFDAWTDLDQNVVSTFDENMCLECDGKNVAYEEVAGSPEDYETCRDAAPDLKRALEDVLAVMRECDEEGTDPDTYDKAVKAANDAIAKAEGRTRRTNPGAQLATGWVTEKHVTLFPDHSLFSAGKRFIPVVEKTGKVLIANVQVDQGDAEQEKHVALICAAPTVLSALKALVAEVGDGFDCDPNQETLAACRSAIAKAEGPPNDS
jgi:hypothetical protein